MTDDTAAPSKQENTGALAGRSTAARGKPDPEGRRTYPPTVTENGQLKAGGCTLGKVEAGPEGEPLLVIEDRYRRRCQARGTKDVPVDLERAAEEARRYIEGKGGDG